MRYSGFTAVSINGALAWIKAGRIELNAFYAWSEKAREKKAECEAGKISFEDFSEWLGNSKKYRRAERKLVLSCGLFIVYCGADFEMAVGKFGPSPFMIKISLSTLGG